MVFANHRVQFMREQVSSICLLLAGIDFACIFSAHVCSCNNLISGLEAFHLFDVTNLQSMFSKAMIIKNDIKSKIYVMFDNPTASHI